MQKISYHSGRILFIFLLIVLPGISSATEKRPMTFEDVMNFHHLHVPTISHNGQWIAYHAWPDRGDGYGILVSANGKTEYRFERAQHPRFSSRGNWVIFNQLPPFSQTEDVKPADRPKDSLLLVQVGNGRSEGFAQLRRAALSQRGEFLFVHQHRPEDKTLTRAQNEKLKKAGTPLIVRNLGNNQQIELPFVDSWSVDSLTTTLIFNLKDTLEHGNGLYQIRLDKLAATPLPVDTTANSRFNLFTWHEETSTLAYVRGCELSKDTTETAALFIWKNGQDAPRLLIANGQAPEGHFIPFDNRLTWSQDGKRLFFGLRPEFLAAKPKLIQTSECVLEALLEKAEIDIWHFEDPLIKTQEKVLWNQLRRQNLMAVYHLDQNRMLQLATEEIPDVQLSRTGNYVVATSTLPHARRITWEGRFRDIYTIDLNTGEKQLVLEEFGDMSLLSPNGRYILYFDNVHWNSYDILREEHRSLTAGLEVPFYDETNDRPAPPSSYRLAGWLEDGQTALIYDRYDIWAADLGSGAIRNITGSFGRNNKIQLRVSRLQSGAFKPRQQLFLEGFNENTKVTAIYSARVDRSGVNLLMDTSQNLKLREMSGDGKAILFTRESFDVFPDVWVSNTSFQKPVMVSNLNSQLKPFNWGTAELISFESTEGVPLQAILVKPGDYDPSKKYPVFVYYYEQYSQRLHDFNQTVINHRPGFGLYSSNGYVMLLPDIHFEQGRPGMSAVNSLVPAAQKLIDMGIADPNAIGLHGHSWSGYQTAYVVTQTDMFRAAIAGAPVGNMTSAYSGIRWGSGQARQFQYETGQSRIGSSMFENRNLYIENSPVFFADRINTPLLLMHGDVDEAVPWEQSIEIYLAMRRLNKDVIFLQYRQELHHPQKYPNKLDYSIRMKEYFDYHLKGLPPAEWIIRSTPFRGK